MNHLQHTILVMNGKGGCGKTTLSTNVASYYASKGLNTTLMDYDPQASSSMWHSLRPNNLPPINLITAYERFSTVTRSWKLRIPLDTQRLIIDVPAGMSGFELQDIIKKVDTILIPVTPSPIDIHATSDFIKELILVGKVRSYPIRIGVVANRVKKESPVYLPLIKFLSRLEIPFITMLWDSMNYVKAAENGMGIFDLEDTDCKDDMSSWKELFDWVDEIKDKSSTNIHYISNRLNNNRLV
ncbi:MAG: ParA family protein [Gammaproteobacteria bacterium]|nr:ParA family protein [Gammaproteobacteria bacterium]